MTYASHDSRLRFAAAVARAVAIAVAVAPMVGRLAAQQAIPDRIPDAAFWKMVADFSEPNGYFRSDNLVSNEDAFQWVIPELQKTVKPGGVYFGVGPDQNFTYIVALQPKISFIVDIRRGDLQELLMYKALIELSADRADFLSRLFSRPRPPGLDTLSTADKMLNAYYSQATPDSNLYNKTFSAIRDDLVRVHGWTLTKEDSDGIEFVLSSFYYGGPWLTYTTNGTAGGRGGNGGMPGYADLQMERDGAGRQRAYLATEANFRVLKDIESRNLIVPLVGNFAGPKTLRAVGQWVREHNATVTTIYTSNVEQYLFQQGDDWSNYYKNVSTLPIDSTSTFIRSVPAQQAYRVQYSGRAASLLCSISQLVKAFAAGQIRSYDDVIAMSR